jgi:hypothetical protein
MIYKENKMSDEVNIREIRINIGDKILVLTPEEARDLNRILSDLFGVREVSKYYPIVIDRPVISTPWEPYKHPYTVTPYWSVTWQGDGNGSNIQLTTLSSKGE